VRGAGRDVQPKIEHDGIELEHLVEVAHEGAVHWHSGSCPVQSEVVDAVPEKDVSIMMWEMKKRVSFSYTSSREPGQGCGCSSAWLVTCNTPLSMTRFHISKVRDLERIRHQQQLFRVSVLQIRR
jgi:hypothetical protein